MIPQLPQDVILGILSFSHPTHVRQFAAVCKLWRETAQDNQLWKSWYLKR